MKEKKAKEKPNSQLIIFSFFSICGKRWWNILFKFDLLGLNLSFEAENNGKFDDSLLSFSKSVGLGMIRGWKGAFCLNNWEDSEPWKLKRKVKIKQNETLNFESLKLSYLTIIIIQFHFISVHSDKRIIHFLTKMSTLLLIQK